MSVWINKKIMDLCVIGGYQGFGKWEEDELEVGLDDGFIGQKQSLRIN